MAVWDLGQQEHSTHKEARGLAESDLPMTDQNLD